MRTIEGHGGALFLVSDTICFVGEPLENAGNGFDWRLADPSLRLLDAGLLVEFLDGEEWRPAPVVAVQRAGARVALARSLSWTRLRASGSARRLLRVADASTFRLRVEVVTAESGVDANGCLTYESRRGERADVALDGCRVDRFLLEHALGRDVLAVLPFLSGCFRAIGRVVPVSVGANADRQGDRLQVAFDEGEIEYGLD